MWSFLGCTYFSGTTGKLRSWDQLEIYLIEPGLGQFFQSRLRLGILLVTLMMNLSLWDKWCPHLHALHLGAFSVRLEVVLSLCIKWQNVQGRFQKHRGQKAFHQKFCYCINLDKISLSAGIRELRFHVSEAEVRTKESWRMPLAKSQFVI